MDPAAERFVEKMGRYFEADGAPRIAGRLFAYLLLQEDALPLDTLAADLRVSKASVSTNARLLMEWGLVERVTRPGDRRDFYVATHDPARALERRLARVREFSELLHEACEAIPNRRPAARRRLETACRFSDEVVRHLTEVLRCRRPHHDA